MILPKLYRQISLSNPTKFRRFRNTLALHNPSLGSLVKSLQIGNSVFDSSGYLPDSLAETSVLSTGIEQILLATKNLVEINLDLFSLSSLHSGTFSRLSSIISRSNSEDENENSIAKLIEIISIIPARPLRLSTELTFSDYFSLPTFSRLRHLDLLIFGLDVSSALDLKRNVKNLRTLSLRLVSTQENLRSTTLLRNPFLEREIERSEDEEGHVKSIQELEDLENFLQGVEVLRSGGWGEEREISGKKDFDGDFGEITTVIGEERRCQHRILRSLTIYTHPSNLKFFKSHYFNESDSQVEILKNDLLSTRNWVCRDEYLKGMEEVTEGCKICGCALGGIIQESSKKVSKKLVETKQSERKEWVSEAESNRLISTILEPGCSDYSSEKKRDGYMEDLAPLRLGLDKNWREGPRKGSLMTWKEDRGWGVWI